MIILTEDNFNETITNSISLVYCWHQTCEPCKQLGPLFEKLEQQFPELQFAKLNVREQKKLKRDLKIIGVPQILVFKDGIMKGTIIHRDEKRLVESFNRIIKSNGKVTDFELPEALRGKKINLGV